MLHVQLIAVSQLDIADGDLLLVFHHGGSHFGLQLSLKLATENICLAARVQLKGTQLVGKLLAIGLKAIHLLGELRLKAGVQLLLLTQSLLQALQNDILRLRTRQPEERLQLRADDRSLEVHCAHSPLREVEILHDQLLARFAANPQLTPDQVVVLTPDIERYAPYIEAVFSAKTGSPREGAPRIPFSLADRSQMPGLRSGVLDWPYTEGLRIDEAMHPLSLLAFGMYGEVLPNQNGAPVRLVVPWKYGFKSAKSIVKIRFVEKEPGTAWNKAAKQEYGFYSNVNPEVDHPRWSQATERRIGEDGLFAKKRKTLMFNGYEAQVGQLYAGMDLKKFY
mgnify:CR=1 FL=1